MPTNDRFRRCFHQQPDDCGRRDWDVPFVLFIGAVYLVTTVWREHILAVIFHIPTAITLDELYTRGLQHQLGNALVKIPGFILLVLLWFLCPSGRLRQSLRLPRVRTAVFAVIATFVLSNVASSLNLWPFAWRWLGDTTAVYASTLLESRQWLAISLWLLVSVIVVPVIEEIVFRFGILRAVRSATGSDFASVFVSAFLFGLGHVGFVTTLSLTERQIVDVAGAFVFGLILGLITVQKNGDVGLPIVVHSVRNLTEIGMLFIAVQLHAT